MNDLLERQRAALSEFNRRIGPDEQEACGLWREALTMLFVFFAVLLMIWPVAFCTAAFASPPFPRGLIFQGEKTWAEWKAAYPPNPSKTWEQVTIDTCTQERGRLEVTEDYEHGLVWFSCLKRDQTMPQLQEPGTTKHGA